MCRAVPGLEMDASQVRAWEISLEDESVLLPS